MDFLRSLSIAASGLKVQSGRMRIISENIANSDSTANVAGGTPYQRKIPTFKSRFDNELGAQVVELGRIERDKSAFASKYEPGHPAANPAGYVLTPNVNSLVEQMDMREAQRTYEANLGVITATRRMVARTLEILRA
jgi:flagellar basal-body rod protein FlgC